jgi:hypothetical protein
MIEEAVSQALSSSPTQLSDRLPWTLKRKALASSCSEIGIAFGALPAGLPPPLDLLIGAKPIFNVRSALNCEQE